MRKLSDRQEGAFETKVHLGRGLRGHSLGHLFVPYCGRDRQEAESDRNEVRARRDGSSTSMRRTHSSVSAEMQ